MFCIIQEIAVKKQNKNGYAKELKSEYMQMFFSGEDMSHYYYTYSNEKFERFIKKAYRISIHKSYRENGKVKKRQFLLCVVNYYDLATDFFTVHDYCGSKIEQAALELSEGTDKDTEEIIEKIYELVKNKIKPLQQHIQEEFAATEEYKMHRRHEEILKLYRQSKAEFARKYRVKESEYDRCYDVFGNLKNKEHLEKIKADYKFRKEYEKKSRSYQEKFFNNYSYGSSKTESNSSVSLLHNKEEKSILKSFYRELSKKYHPDANPDKDTSKEMQLLNQLKQEWNL